MNQPLKPDDRAKLVEQLRMVQHHPAFLSLRDWIDQAYEAPDYAFEDLAAVRIHADLAHIAGRKSELNFLRELFKEAGMPKKPDKQDLTKTT